MVGEGFAWEEKGMIEVYFRPHLIWHCFSCPDGPSIYNDGSHTTKKQINRFEDSDDMIHIKEQFLAQMMGWA